LAHTICYMHRKGHQLASIAPRARRSWMPHRIRYTMKQNPFTDKLDGIVEADETYIGGKRYCMSGSKAHKLPVVSLLQRDGKVRSFHMLRVTAKNLKSVIHENVSPDYDGFTSWLYWACEKVCRTSNSEPHMAHEYARGPEYG